jgi:hypothetical protein
MDSTQRFSTQEPDLGGIKVVHARALKGEAIELNDLASIYYALRYLEYSDIKTEYFNDLYKWTLRTLIILNKREDTQKNRFIRNYTNQFIDISALYHRKLLEISCRDPALP